MDKETARKILAAYRPNGADANEEAFAEALQLARNDPETEKWLEEESAFDKRVAATMDSIPVSSGDRNALESMLDFESGDRSASLWSRFGRRGTLSLAAIFALVVGLWGILRVTYETRAPDDGRSLTSFVEQIDSLDFPTSDYREMSAWFAEKGVILPKSVAERVEGSSGLGCKIFQYTEDGSVALLCFENNGRIVHLLALGGNASKLADGVPNAWTVVDGWNFRRLPSEGTPLILLTDADPSEIDPALWI